jgi:phage-related protein
LTGRGSLNFPAFDAAEADLLQARRWLAGVLEIGEDYAGDTYRAVYTVKFAGTVYALHAFQKKSTQGKKTAKQEVDLVKQRLKRAEEHYAQWSTSQKENPRTQND